MSEAKNENVKKPGRVRRLLASMRLYFLSWLSVTGLVATTSTCPFCGQAGCPVGIGQAASLGIFAAFTLWVLTKLGLMKKKQHVHEHAHDHVHEHHSHS